MVVPESHALVVTDVFPPEVGGSGELLHNVYRRLGRAQVTVLAPWSPGLPRDSMEYGMRVRRERTRTGTLGVLHPAGLWNHMCRAASIRRLGAGRTTVVHCSRGLPEGLGAWLAGRWTGVPYVVWAYGEELAYARTSREHLKLTRLVHRRADALISISRHTSRLLEDLGVSRDRIELVPPGVDANRFRPDVAGRAELRGRLAPSGEIVLLTVGRLQRRKGHDLVVRTLATLPASPLVRYVIVGDGEERDGLTALAAGLGVADRVLFVGGVAPADLPAYYAAADIFVHPNRIDGQDFEGFGIVFLEAAAAELPVIGGRSGGVPDAVADGTTGLLVSGTSVPELRAALEALIRDPERRLGLGAAGRLRVCRDFSWERAARAVSALHLRAASRRLTRVQV